MLKPVSLREGALRINENIRHYADFANNMDRRRCFGFEMKVETATFAES